MKNMMRVALIASMAVAFTACSKKEEGKPQVDDAATALVAPAKDDDAGWKKYLSDMAVQNMGKTTNAPFLYYLPPESDPEFADKYQRQVDAAKTAIARGVQPGNMIAFGSSASAKMAEMIEAAFKDVAPNSMKGVRIVFIGQQADSDRAKAAVEPTGADYVFVEAK